MTAEQFVYWLQGFMEVANPTQLTETQTRQIKDHLNLVFDKQTPDRTILPTDPYPRWSEPHTFPLNPDLFKPICGSDLNYINTEPDIHIKRIYGEMEESHNKLFCETMRVPPHMFGERKQNNIIKQAMEIASKDVQIPKVVREGKVQMNKNIAGKGGLKC